MSDDTKRKAAIKACEAMSDINTFGIVISTLEDGHVHAPSRAAARKIIRICKREMQHRLEEWAHSIDRAVSS